MAYSSNTFKIPKIREITARFDGDEFAPIEMSYDEILYDSRTMTYQSRDQYYKIQELEKKLIIKDKEKEKSLKSLIGYFYQRNR